LSLGDLASLGGLQLLELLQQRQVWSCGGICGRRGCSRRHRDKPDLADDDLVQRARRFADHSRTTGARVSSMLPVSVTGLNSLAAVISSARGRLFLAALASSEDSRKGKAPAPVGRLAPELGVAPEEGKAGFLGPSNA